MKIIFYRENLNACSYYRCLVPSKYLNKISNISSIVTPSLSEDQIKNSDIIVFQKKVTNEDFKKLKYAKELGKKIVYEIDDNVFDIPIWNPSYNSINTFVPKFRLFIENSDLITVTCPYLANELKRFNKEIKILPNSIDFEEVDNLKQIIPTIYNQQLESIKFEDYLNFIDHKLVIGWAGSPTHKEDLKLTTSSLLKLLHENQNIVVVMVLGADQALVTKAPKNQIFCVSAVKLEEYYSLLKQLRFDIGLAPLADVNFNKSKSNLKIIEYMALSIIPLASSLENYTKTLQPSFNNLLIKSNIKEEWYIKLKELYTKNLIQLAIKIRKFASENYDIKTNISFWMGSYKDLMEKR